MLILDKSRTLDLMIARSEQVLVPDDFNTAATAAQPRRIAVYAPGPAYEPPPQRTGAASPTEALGVGAA